jgi:hypothetical protein
MIREVKNKTTATTEQTITPDDIFDQIAETNKIYDETEKKLIEFVEKQVELSKDNLLFAGREPSFYELNTALSNFETVAIGLTSLYSTVRIDADLAQEKYDDAYAAWFVEERNALQNLGDKKMPSTKEIDMIVRTSHMKELAKLKAEIIATDTKRNMVDRLIKNWDGYQFCLSTLSRNAVAESVASRTTGNHVPDLGE